MADRRAQRQHVRSTWLRVSLELRRQTWLHGPAPEDREGDNEGCERADSRPYASVQKGNDRQEIDELSLSFYPLSHFAVISISDCSTYEAAWQEAQQDQKEC
jgi:hypothetical protein